MYHKTAQVLLLAKKPAAAATHPFAEPPEVVEQLEERAHGQLQWRMLPFLSLPLFVTIFLAYIRSKELGPSYFALHPTGELIALISLISSIIAGKAEGIAGTYKQNVFALISWLSALFGFYIVFTTKQYYNKPHFLSAHSHLGLLTFTSIMIYTVSSVAYFNPRNGPQRDNVQAFQRQTNVGRLICILGLLTASFGILELEPHTVPNAISWIGTFTIFIPLLV